MSPTGPPFASRRTACFGRVDIFHPSRRCFIPLTIRRHKTTSVINHRVSKISAYGLAAILIIFASGCGPSDKTRALESTAASIVEGYEALALESRNLNQQAQQFCADPDNAGLQKTRAQWKTTMDAWMRIQPINFGPIR